MKVGDKIVCVKKGNWKGSSAIKAPKYNEVVIITGNHPTDSNFFFIKGYERDENGDRQAFYKGRFKPLEPHTFKNELTKELSLEVLTRDLERIEIKEKELV